MNIKFAAEAFSSYNGYYWLSIIEKEIRGLRVGGSVFWWHFVVRMLRLKLKPPCLWASDGAHTPPEKFLQTVLVWGFCFTGGDSCGSVGNSATNWFPAALWATALGSKEGLSTHTWKPDGKAPSSGCIKDQILFCECSDTVFSCLLNSFFTEKEKIKGKIRERKGERQGITWTQGSLLTCPETQGGNTLGKSLALSKSGFLHRGMRTLPQCFQILGRWTFTVSCQLSSPYSVGTNVPWSLFSCFLSSITPGVSIISLLGWRGEKKHNRLCHLLPELASSLSLSLLICKMRLTIHTWKGCFYKSCKNSKYMVNHLLFYTSE